MLLHTDYTRNYLNYEKFRYTIEGGPAFVDKYLRRYSRKETDREFLERKALSYCRAVAKQAVLEIKNSIYQRMGDVNRVSDDKSYLKAINNDVDRAGNTLKSFLGRYILIELLALGKVGIFVDKLDFPYLYYYSAEDILNWTYTENNELSAVLLKHHTEEIDEETGLSKGFVDKYRLFKKTEEGVLVSDYDKNNHITSSYLLDLPEIPFILLELSQSLLHDIADYQIALTNIASSDLNYIISANFPIYTEQYNPGDSLPHLKKLGEGETDEYVDSKVDLGVAKGRQYPRGVERPAFIAPPTDPIKASMEKAKELKEEVREILHLTLVNIRSTHVPVEMERMNQLRAEAGLSSIALELEYGERQINKFWSMYQGTEPGTINYPTNYSLRTLEDRINQSKDLNEIKKNRVSATLKRVIERTISLDLANSYATDQENEQILKEIEQSEVLVVDHDTVRDDHERGLVSTSTASEILGYPEGESAKAELDHAKRLARIAEAQSKDVSGVKDTQSDEKDQVNFTRNSDPDSTDTGKVPVRGEGK